MDTTLKPKERFTLIDLYWSAVWMMPAMIGLIRHAIRPRVSKKTIERLMLAVTEVNGCEVCSFAHTKMALKQGFTKEEIHAMLTASGEFIPKEEAVAIFFAQHYAESKGTPAKESYERFIATYGKKNGRVMRHAIQMMMYANLTGLPISALAARFKKRPYPESSFGYELFMILSTPLITILALPHVLLNMLFFRPTIRLSK
ncbi:MAG: carboxymuconolactone decarboxylase family protein [Acholeplasmataceae bacterium]|nr:carboxymuconolactone decarboxylase family protein [Acholeplasmataceae bacterium]